MEPTLPSTPTPEPFGLVKITDFESFWEIIILDTLLTPRNLFIIVPVWLLLHAMEKASPRGKVKTNLMRARELLYMLGCCILVWTPGLRPHVTSWGYRIGLGIVLGGLTTLVPIGLNWLGDKVGWDALKDDRKAARDAAKACKTPSTKR